VKSAVSQAELLRKRVPIEEALKDPRLSAEQKRKMLLAQEAKSFAETNLGLAKTKNYSAFVQLDRPYVTYVVSAASKNELKHFLWDYPLVGSLPYKGFFDPAGAKEEAEKLKAENLDVFVRGVSAYSTLGWLSDPILSSMLAYKDFDLVNTIIHETVHATIYIKSRADFNERLATFIGNIGTKAFYSAHEGADSATLKAIDVDAHDDRIFGEFISKELDILDKWYEERKGQTISESERQARFKEIQAHFAIQVRPALQDKTLFKGFETTELNNARLLTFRMYVNDLGDFQVVFDKQGRDFNKMMQFCKTLQDADDPEEALKRAGVASL
jgi:predicted aminopeptidase